MTREQKLALIIGFSLILLVGVLISDHLSRARALRIARVDDADAAVHLPAAGPAGQFDPLPSDPVPARSDPLPSQQPAEPELAASEAPGLANPAGEPLIQLVQESPRSADRPGSPVGLDELAQRLGGEPASNPLADTPPSGTPHAAGPAPDAAILAAPAPEAQFYLVRQRDSLYSISQRAYGTPRHWQRIADENRDRIGRSGVLRVGTRLRLPVIDGVAPNLDAAHADAPPPARPAPQRLASGSVYKVRKGDTVGTIAQRELGSARRAREIIALNQSVIRDANRIIEGMELRLPSR